MPVYIYKGKTKGGKEISGEMDVADRNQVITFLRKRKIIISQVREKPKELNIPFGKRVKGKHVVLIARQLATMITAGLPLVNCLGILAKQTESERLKEIILDIQTSVESGSTFSEGLEKHKKIFGEIFIHMVSAGEAGGILDTILLRLAVYLEKAAALKSKIKSAMMYPAVIMTAAMGATIFLLVSVIPTFANMFANFGATLPLPTRIVLAISHILSSYFYILILAVVGIVVGLKFLYKTDNGALFLDKWRLKLPIFGHLFKKVAISRFTRTLGTLISSGVPILDGLEITAKTSGNRVVHDAILKARSSISEGEAISEPLSNSNTFPPMVVQMISVGEKTGNLDEMLDKISDFYDDEVDTAVSSLTSVLEPIMIVLMGVIIGGIVIAVYMPMFDLIKAIRGM
jgi:type IV pilus assembly protein PilC